MQLQKEKLTKISTLYVSYFLRLSQIANLVRIDDQLKLPPQLDKSVLFTEEGLLKLEETKDGLREEISRLL